MGQKNGGGKDIKVKRAQLLRLFPEEILGELLDAGYPEDRLRAFYGENIFRWLHQKLKRDPNEFSDLPKDLRQFLTWNFSCFVLQPDKSLVSGDSSEKIRFVCSDGERIEAVYLPYHRRKTVCVSSQVGCKWGCKFCYTGKMGFRRNLMAEEIVEQVYWFVRKYEAITHVVYMGMGEPLDNYEEVLRSIKLLNHPKGQHIGMRRITISTIGIIPAIERLLTERIQVNLAISLHNPIPEERQELVPGEKVYPLKRLVPLLQKYYQITHRQITFEYVVLPGENDDIRHARRLAKLCKGWDCKVNLIPYNMIGMSLRQWKQNKDACTVFRSKLWRFGLSKVTIRSSRGWDVAGACGQLGIMGKSD